MMMIPATFRRLRRNRQASAALELALAAPVLFAMAFGGIDIGRAYGMKLDLEQAAGRTAEMATAPGTVSGTYANLRNEVIAAYGKPYTTAVVDEWLECGSVRQGSFTGTCVPGAQIARYVSIYIEAEYVPIFNYGGLLSGKGPSGGLITRGDAVVRIQ